jgi:Protein of unknown function (DUF2637)
MTARQPHGDPRDVSPNGSGPRDPEWATSAERQAAARRAYVQSVAGGTPLTGVALGAVFDRSGRWGSQRILEARRQLVSDGPGTGSPPNGSGVAPNGRASPPIGLPENSPTAGRQADREQRAADMASRSANPAIARTTTLAVLAVALVAAIASYDHQRLLADMAGEEWRAWLLPISVDGLILTASRTMLTRQRSGRSAGWLAWTAMLAGLTASLAANVAGAEPTLVGRLVAAWPPVALLLAYELLMQQVRANSRRDTAGRTSPPQPSATPGRRSAGRHSTQTVRSRREQGETPWA